MLKSVVVFLLVDSDSDNFLSLKKASKPKQNGTAKPTKPEPGSSHSGSKAQAKSPIKPSSSQAKTGLKSPPAPTTPKSAPPPPPRQTPTSVLDYFGMGTIQRSDKKLVASAKRKAVRSDDFSAATSLLWSNLHRTNWLCKKKLLCFSADSGLGGPDKWWRNGSAAADGRGVGGRQTGGCFLISHVVKSETGVYWSVCRQ